MSAVVIDMRDEIVRLPAGRYEVEVEDVDLAEVEPGPGQHMIRLYLRLVVIDGPFMGAVLWALRRSGPAPCHAFRAEMRALGFGETEMEIGIKTTSAPLEEGEDMEAEDIETVFVYSVVKPEFVGRRAIAIVGLDEKHGNWVTTLRRLPNGTTQEVLRTYS